MKKKYTQTGTDIQEVKKQNAGNILAPNTNPQKVMEEIAQEVGFSQSSQQKSAGKTVTGTDIAEVKRQNNKSNNQ